MRAVVIVLVTAGLVLLAAQPAAACATCFGAADAALTKGMNGAILTLLVIIGVVQVGFLAMFASFVIRSRRLREHKARFRLIRGGAR